MKKVTEYFTLMKVVDPYYNMPEDIQGLFIDEYRNEERGNNSFINYTVGSYQEEPQKYDYTDSSKGKLSKHFINLKKIDDWALEHFVQGEKILILYWW
jgi:hypothetical protein